MIVTQELRDEAQRLARKALDYRAKGDNASAAMCMLNLAVYLAGARPEFWQAVEAVAAGDLERAASIMNGAE